ncbi:MAG: response regulator transcription factor [Myxococcota bacterium]
MSDGTPHLLIVEDDPRFADTLRGEFTDRGYAVSAVESLADLETLTADRVDRAVVDLRLRRDSGLDALSQIKERWPEASVVVLTGYGSIATAVQAVKLGAHNYLTKPVDIDQIERAFQGAPGIDIQEEEPSEGEPAEFQTLARHEREYIEYVLAECDGNISQAARRLGLHRQSLQRKLRKYTPHT